MTIGELLKAALDSDGLTIYRAAQMVREKTGEPLPTIHRRISCYTATEPPKTIQQLQAVCEALGYKFTLTKILDSPLVAKHNGHQGSIGDRLPLC